MSQRKRTSRLVSTENWHGKATFVNTESSTFVSQRKRTSRIVSTENWHGKATFVNTDVTKEEDVKVS